MSTERGAIHRFIFGETEEKIVELKIYIDEWKAKLPSLIELDGRRGSNEQKAIIFEKKRAFDTAPKPVELITDLISFAADKNAIVLDSFAGSGSSGQAVLELNKQDKGTRKFILVEMSEDVSTNVTAERLKRVISGYNKGGTQDKLVDGLGGGFRYCRLGTPLFNEFGDIDTAVAFSDLAAHIFFSETGSPLPKKADGSTPLIGVHKNKLVYLLFSAAEQGFAREDAGNVLTPDVLAGLPPLPDELEGSRVVYAEGCTVSPERLKAENVIFKQIPYQIEGN